MSLSYENCGAVILAGGRSSRMGSCKALLPVNGKPLIEGIYEHLSDFSDCCLSANDDILEGILPVPVIRDTYVHCGPLGGIHAALQTVEKEAVFVAACDLPFFNREIPRLMLQMFPGDADVMVCRDSDGRVHPLCGIYRKRILSRVEGQLQNGKRKIMMLLEEVNCAFFDVEKYLPEEVLCNMNTPEDYCKFQDFPLKKV